VSEKQQQKEMVRNKDVFALLMRSVWAHAMTMMGSLMLAAGAVLAAIIQPWLWFEREE